MGSVPTLHVSYHLGQHYNSVRALLDPCTGAAIDHPIGHELKLKDEPSVPENNAEPDNIIDQAIKTLCMPRKKIMKEALE